MTEPSRAPLLVVSSILIGTVWVIAGAGWNGVWLVGAGLAVAGLLHADALCVSWLGDDDPSQGRAYPDAVLGLSRNADPDA